ncbi:hypothetical protein FD754_004503 [Muntiacus muntjak]|uniref:Conserved oligomeric Golgi complex subunit 2 n=1 Tax=Muntiacus muntjak TaxID=9888 RepID=A0A5N3WH52_MUNMU|nr:hypothetical protein FD754_004503 [Muntiacus muntjak]
MKSLLGLRQQERMLLVRGLPLGTLIVCKRLSEDFDVSHFVSDCQKRVQLEALRDDLELYYKLLETAMVELINKDYTDFVNLSINLVGMDKALNQLSAPLGQLGEEVLNLQSSVSEGILAVGERIDNCVFCLIIILQIRVLWLIQVIPSVEKIEKILNSQHSKETSALEASSPLLTGQMLERIATDFNQLQFHAVQSKGLPLLDKIRPHIAGITAMLQQSLEGLLLEGLQTSSATIDKTRDAEASVGQVLVKPYVDEVILEQIVDSRLSDLQLMYDKLLEFVPHHCRLLREVTGGAISSEKGNTVPGYDFLVNSVWPEIVRGLEEKLPLLFNPGHPDAFHQLPFPLMDFVRTLEQQCGSQASVKRLRAHPAYHNFNNKWSLPVYFQIIFREIAGSLEAALADVLEDAPAGSSYHLLTSHRTWSSLRRCWSDKMFLPLLAHPLWRLTLQILARYSIFVKEVRADCYMLMYLAGGNILLLKSFFSLYSGPSITQGHREDQASGPSETKPIVSTSSTQLVCVVTDLDRLHEQCMFISAPELLETIKPKHEVMDFKNFSSISGGADEITLNVSVQPLSHSGKFLHIRRWLQAGFHKQDHPCKGQACRALCPSATGRDCLPMASSSTRPADLQGAGSRTGPADQTKGCGIPAGEITRQDKSLGAPSHTRLLGETSQFGALCEGTSRSAQRTKDPEAGPCISASLCDTCKGIPC